MKFVRETSPYIRKNVSVKRMMLDVLIALVPIVLFACIQNGFNGFYVILTAILTMLVVEFIAVGLIKWPDGMKRRELFTKEGFKRLVGQYNINNIYCPMISALIFSLLLPAATPVYVVIVGSLVGVLFGKLVFGVYGSNIFNPAAVGFIFVKLCFAGQIDAALATQTGIVFPGLIENGVIVGGTPLGQISGNLNNFGQAIIQYPLKDLFFGNVPGAMGEVCSVLILVSFVYLIARRAIDLRASLSMILGFVLISLSVGIVLNIQNGTNILEFVTYQVLAGGLLFGAVFMVTDPVTSPVTKFGRVVYGTIVGVLAAMIRFIGAYPEGVAFAILLANTFASAIDYFMQGKPNTYTWKQILGLSIVVVAACLIVAFTVNTKIQPETTNMILGGVLSCGNI